MHYIGREMDVRPIGIQLAHPRYLFRIGLFTKQNLPVLKAMKGYTPESKPRSTKELLITSGMQYVSDGVSMRPKRLSPRQVN